MSIPSTLRHYLEDAGMSYEVVRHPRTFSSMETAEAAHVPGDRVAKSVVVENDTGYMIAVIPATHRLLFGALRERFGTGFGLATEAEIAALFADCEKGAIPPFGEAYGLRVLVDQDLLDEDELYCESGDHSELLHLRGRDFRALMAGAERGGFSRHV